MTENMSYVTDSFVWSAFYFLAGYLVCRLEIQIRESLRDPKRPKKDKK